MKNSARGMLVREMLPPLADVLSSGRLSVADLLLNEDMPNAMKNQLSDVFDYLMVNGGAPLRTVYQRALTTMHDSKIEFHKWRGPSSASSIAFRSQSYSTISIPY
jgi:hypothetical protein